MNEMLFVKSFVTFVLNNRVKKEMTDFLPKKARSKYHKTILEEYFIYCLFFTSKLIKLETLSTFGTICCRAQVCVVKFNGGYQILSFQIYLLSLS